MQAKIKFEPKTSSSHLNFSYGSKMGSMSKVHMVYESAFWRDLCLSGSVAGSLEGTKGWLGPTYCEFIADSSPPGKRPGILTAFIAGERNQEIEGWSREDVKKQVLKELCEYFRGKVPDSEVFREFGPSRPEEEPEFFYRNWNTRPWSCGAFTSYLPPNTWFPYGKDGWRKPAWWAQGRDYGRVFYAGTETSERWPGYYDGAIRAGKRAAAGVLSTSKTAFDPKIFDPNRPDDPSFPRWTEETSCLPQAGG
jgi:monoamine oxidase